MRKFSSTASALAARQHKSAVKTRFPTKYNPARSAFNQKIMMPAGVVYNPAPSAPSAYDTPAAFLPKEERELRSWAKDAEPYNVSTMPPVTKTSSEPRYNLTREDTAEIQRLRHEDPYKWTRKKLAEKFNVSEYMIGLCSNPEASHAEDMSARLAMIQSQWTERRARARMHRIKRKGYWLRDA